MHAGLNPNEQLAPKFRNAIGAVAFNPSVSGNVDYMMGAQFAKTVADIIFKQTNQKITSLDELRSHPIAKAIYNMPQHLAPNSPISKNFLNALNPDLPPSRLVNMIEGFGGSGPDQQQWGGRAGLLGSAALGAVNPFSGGGLHGALTNVVTQLPETAATALMNRNKDSLMSRLLLRAGLKTKKKIMASGFLEGLDGKQSEHTFNNSLLNYLNTTSGEVRALGGDLGALTRAATSEHGIPSVPELNQVVTKVQSFLADPRDARRAYKPPTPREAIRDGVHEKRLGESYHANRRRNPGTPKPPMAVGPVSRPIDPVSGREVMPSRTPRVKPAPNPFFTPTPIKQPA
jgi:hypothetical protein